MRIRLTSMSLLACCLAWVSPALAQQTAPNATSLRAKFNLIVNTPFLTCLQGSGKTAPTATVTLVQGKLNDTLTIKVQHVKPKLAFDLFTVQNSPFFADGSADGSFPGNFGLAWYQSDIQTNSSGSGSATIHTILSTRFSALTREPGWRRPTRFTLDFGSTIRRMQPRAASPERHRSTGSTPRDLWL